VSFCVVTRPRRVLDPVTRPRRVLDPVTRPRRVLDPVTRPRRVLDPVTRPRRVLKSFYDFMKIVVDSVIDLCYIISVSYFIECR
jgi:hypothetical protein